MQNDGHLGIRVFLFNDIEISSRIHKGICDYWTLAFEAFPNKKLSKLNRSEKKSNRKEYPSDASKDFRFYGVSQKTEVHGFACNGVSETIS